MSMLSRVGNNLYWIGRYIERAEHHARYMKEIYFSSLDAPIAESHERTFVLESMLYMAGIFDMKDLDERSVLHKIGLDADNSNSLLSILTSARENARGVRNVISVDLWEAINKYYHFINNYDKDVFLSNGLYDVTQTILEQTSIVRGKIYGSLLHDESWAIISIGMHIERALQIISIINAKLHDIYKIEKAGYEVNALSFEWTTLLRCTESFDMNRKYYRNIPQKEQVLEFLLLNPKNPRSIVHSLTGISNYLERVIITKEQNPKSIEYKIGKLVAQYKYLSIDEFKDDIYKLLNSTQNKLNEISSDLEKKYFSY